MIRGMGRLGILIKITYKDIRKVLGHQEILEFQVHYKQFGKVVDMVNDLNQDDLENCHKNNSQDHIIKENFKLYDDLQETLKSYALGWVLNFFT